MAQTITLKLTDRQLKTLWDVVDGAMDAGACDDGLTPKEQEALSQIMSKMLPFILERNKRLKAERGL